MDASGRPAGAELLAACKKCQLTFSPRSLCQNQELLLEEAGLDLAQLRRLSRWGAMAPAIAARLNPELQRRQTTSTVLRRVSVTSLGSAAVALPASALSRVASSRSGSSSQNGSSGGGGGAAGDAGAQGASGGGCAYQLRKLMLSTSSMRPCMQFAWQLKQHS